MRWQKNLKIPSAAMPWVEAVVYTGLIILLGWLCFTTAPLYDDFLYADLGKSIAAGTGWRLHYPEILVPSLGKMNGLFNPEVGAGPVFLLTLALAIKIAGNLYWVPGMMTLISCILVIGAILYVASRSEIGWGSLQRLLFVLLIAFFSYDTLQADRPLLFKFLHKGYGDVVAALALVLGFMLFTARRRDNDVRASLFGATAVLIKPLPSMSWIASFGVLAILRLIAVRKWVAPVVMALVPVFAVAVFAVIKSIIIGNGRDAAWLAAVEKRFFFYKGSGIGQWMDADDKVVYLIENTAHQITGISSFYGSPFIAAALVVFVIALCARSFICFVPDGKRRVYAEGLALLSVAALVQYVWYLFIAYEPVERHFMTAGVLANALLVLSLKDSATWVRRTSACLIGILLLTRLIALPGTLDALGPSAVRLKSQFDTAAFLQSGALPQDVTLMGCDWWANRDLEYLMPGQGHFKECRRLLADPNSMDEKLVLVRSDFWEGPVENLVGPICDKNILFRTPLHTVSYCGTKRDLLQQMQILRQIRN